MKVFYHNFLKRFRNPESMYNHVSYLFLGNLVTILSQFVFAPLITRYYTPESYGTFSAFFAAGLSLSTLLTLRYEQSLLLEENPENRDRIAAILVTFGFYFTGLLMGVMLIDADFFSALIGATGSSYWILLFPVFVFLNVFFLVTGVESTIAKKFRDAFVCGAPTMASSKLINLGYGYAFNGHFSGLLLGDIYLRLVYVTFRLGISLKKKLARYFIFSLSQLRQTVVLLVKYKRFPLYDLPAMYINMIVGQSHIYFLTALKQHMVLGWVGISFALLDAPLRLISYSVSPVLMHRATVMRDQMPEFRKLLIRVVTGIYLVALLPSAILFFWGGEIFSFVFGSQWAMSGLIVSSFIFFYTFRFEYDILDNIMSVLGLQKSKLLVYVVEGFTRISLLIITWLILRDPLQTIITWAYECAIVYFFVTMYAYRLLHLRMSRLLVLKTMISILFLGAYFFKHVW